MLGTGCRDRFMRCLGKNISPCKTVEEMPFKGQVMYCDTYVHIRREVIQKSIEVFYISSIIVSVIDAELPDIRKCSGISPCPILRIFTLLIEIGFSVNIIKIGCGLNVKSEDILA